MLRLQRNIGSLPYLRLNPILRIRTFSTSRCLLNIQDKSIAIDPSLKRVKKRHSAPKTLEKLVHVSEEKQQEKTGEKTEPIDKPKKASTKPLDVITTGPKVPQNWRKMENLPEWKRQKFALLEKFKGQKWDPKKKLSREEMKSVRILKKAMPELTTTDLSKHFQVSPEAIRRILKSKWNPNEEEDEEMYERWKKRGERLKSELKKNNQEKKEISTPKVIIRSGKEYDKVRFDKNGQITAKNTPFEVNKYGAAHRVNRLSNTNKLGKMKF